MNVDTRAGAGMVPSLSAWPDAAEHQAALAAFYDRLAGEIEAGQSASVKSAGAYKTVTKRILKTLGLIAGLDAASRELASGAGIDLPVVVIPEALR
jgi:hypothetical protein